MRSLVALVAALLVAIAPAAAQAQSTQRFEEIVARHSSALSFDKGRLSGPGAAALLDAARGAQFVIVIEPHNDHVTPHVTAALFRELHRAEAFNYVAIEQDPLGMEAASLPPLRGRLAAIARHARDYPYSYTFSSDEELALLAQAGTVSAGRWNPIWGFDQLFGATLALEQLERLATGALARSAVRELLLGVRAVEARRTADGQRDHRSNHYLAANEEEMLRRIDRIRALVKPKPGSRAAMLIDAIRSSAEIYSYYDPKPPLDARGTPRGLLNNTVREALMKSTFIQNYRKAEAVDATLPKVLVKAGYYHSVRGLSSNGVFTLGNFLHEFAAANERHAVSVQVLALREWWPTYESIEPAYRALLPARTMDRPTLVDLRPLRAHLHGGQTFGLGGQDLNRLRELVYGVDFALFIPSKPGSYNLTRTPAS